MSKRYEITGHPLSFPSDVVHATPIGDTIEHDFDDDEEQVLIEIGAIRPLPKEEKKPAAKATPRPSK